MLHLDLESKSVEEKPSPSAPTIVQVKLTQIAEVIRNYTKLHEFSRKNSILPNFILDRINKESPTITSLRNFIPPLIFDEQEELNSIQLLDLALALSKVRSTRDNILAEAIQPLIDAIGNTRLDAVKKLANKPKARAAILFDSLCHIDNQYVPYIAPIYAFETMKFQFTPENIKMIQENPARIKELYHQITQSKNKLGNNLDLSSAVSFFMFFTQQVRSSNPTWINHFINQLVAAAIKHKEYMVEVVYALAWLTNHGISTPENEAIVDSRPEDLSYLPEIGFTAVKDETTDSQFNQRLFQFALEQGISRRPLRLFDQVEMNEVKDEDPVAMPKLTRS